MSPDDVFIRSLESHLDWPVLGTHDYLIRTSDQDSTFATKLQFWMSDEMNWTFDPADRENWRETLERAECTLCYVFCNNGVAKPLRPIGQRDISHVRELAVR